jgi:hypothetical protein
MPWSALAVVAEQSALPAMWESLLGPSFASFKNVFLEPAGSMTGLVPCPLNCGCYHMTVPRHDGAGAIAICRCIPPRCPDIPLTIEQATPLFLNRARLARALCRVLDCHRVSSELAVGHCVQIGAWSADAVPVILCLRTDAASFRSAIPELAMRLGRAFILFAPTPAHMTAACYELLADAQSLFFALANTVSMSLHDGRLYPLKTPGELFAPLTPQPRQGINENTAIDLLRLIHLLSAKENFKKAQPYAVFVHYFANGLSAAETARACKCTKGLIFIRLRWLRQKLGHSPAQLRAIAAQHHDLITAPSDPRARRLNPQRAVD